MTREIIDASVLDLEERVVTINRVAKVVKGGRRFSFSALVVVGNGDGIVGVGMGKAGEVPEAIRKGVEDAKKNLIRVPVVEGGTIPHETIGRFGAARVMLKPASEGYQGVIAGGAVPCRSRIGRYLQYPHQSLRSDNQINIVRATIAGLQSMKSAEQVAKLRGKTVEEILG